MEKVVNWNNAVGDGEIASRVEKCNCPTGYKGLSCEDCAPGWTRLKVSNNEETPLGQCVRCDCNGDSTCHPETGECQVLICGAYIVNKLYSFYNNITTITFSIIHSIETYLITFI